MNTQTNPVPACFDVRKVLTANAYNARKPRTPRKAYAPKPAMLSHAITAGVGYDATGEVVENQTAKVHAIRLHLAINFGGYSETVVRGGYMHANGDFVNEESRVWTIVTSASAKAIMQACEFIRATLNQESVLLVTTKPTQVKFVGVA